MTGSGSPCGACKFLRRKCVKGCVFAPYFWHEQGASQFAAIHKVFGASNASRLLAHLPVCDRAEAAVTISYEAQARLHDPVYGCVSHIFSLQQQVVNLQAQIASLKEQAAHGFLNDPNQGLRSSPQDVQSVFQSDNYAALPRFDPNRTSKIGDVSSLHGKGKYIIPNSRGCLEIPYACGDICSSSVREDGSPSMDEQWSLADDVDNLESLSFRYIGHP